MWHGNIDYTNRAFRERDLVRRQCGCMGRVVSKKFVTLLEVLISSSCGSGSCYLYKNRAYILSAVSCHREQVLTDLLDRVES